MTCHHHSTYTSQRRRAELNVTINLANHYSIPEGNVPCYVLGFFQEADADGAYACAVCELEDGKVITVMADKLKFTDNKEA